MTLSSLTKLKSKIKSNEKEMKQMLEKDIRYLENYKDEQELIFRCIDEHGDSYSDDDEDWKPKMNEMCEGPADKMLHFLKLCLKSISGHSESFWKKISGEKKEGAIHFLSILGFCKFLQVFIISLK